MSTAVAPAPAASHSSPLRPRDHEKSSPRSHQAATSKSPRQEAAPRAQSDGAARGERSSNRSRSPASAERNASRPGGPARRSRSPINGQSTPSKAGAVMASNSSPNVPIIKKEQPSSPEQHSHTRGELASAGPVSARHRPRRLDLSRDRGVPQGAATAGARPSGSLGSKESAGLASMQEVGLACLSPGFNTFNPQMRDNLQRSQDVKAQQKRLIEARLHGKPEPARNPAVENSAGATPQFAPHTSVFSKAPGTSRRKAPPPGLSISASSAQQFDEPRVIQSAPLNQTFTGLHQKPSNASSLSRQVLDPSHRAHAGHSHGESSGNRLPPISDVFREGIAPARHPSGSGFQAPHTTYSPAQQNSQHQPPLPSPGYPPPPASAGLHPPRAHETQTTPSGHRQREFKSAEDAVQALSGGREDLLPKLVHYGGHQPPTPPSPHPQQPGAPPAPSSQAAPRLEYGPHTSTNRRRTREEYERDYAENERLELDVRERQREREWVRERELRERGGAGLAAGAPPAPRPVFDRAYEEERGRRAVAYPGQVYGGRDSPESARRKKDEFMALCARAWDLLHS